MAYLDDSIGHRYPRAPLYIVINWTIQIVQQPANHPAACKRLLIYSLLTIWWYLLVYIRFLVLYGPWLTDHSISISILATFGFHLPIVPDKIYTESTEWVMLHPPIQLKTGYIPDQSTIICEVIPYCVCWRVYLNNRSKQLSIGVENNHGSDSDPRLYARGNMLIAALPTATYKIHWHNSTGIERPHAKNITRRSIMIRYIGIFTTESLPMILWYHDHVASLLSIKLQKLTPNLSSNQSIGRWYKVGMWITVKYFQ